jgi:hypothetical protein
VSPKAEYLKKSLRFKSFGFIFILKMELLFSDEPSSRSMGQESKLPVAKRLYLRPRTTVKNPLDTITAGPEAAKAYESVGFAAGPKLSLPLLSSVGREIKTGSGKILLLHV